MSDPSNQTRPALRVYPGILFVLGALTGSTIGYLLRPAVFLIGQLPFGTVITRGTRLQGLDTLLLVSAAQQSFDDLVLGFLAGLAAAYLLVLLIRQKS